MKTQSCVVEKEVMMQKKIDELTERHQQKISELSDLMLVSSKPQLKAKVCLTPLYTTLFVRAQLSNARHQYTTTKSQGMSNTFIYISICQLSNARLQ